MAECDDSCTDRDYVYHMYEWARHLRQVGIQFCRFTDKVRVVRPDPRSFSASSVNLATIKRNSAHGLIVMEKLNREQKSFPNFFNSALSRLHSEGDLEYPSDAFHLLGIDILCAQTMEDIYLYEQMERCVATEIVMNDTSQLVCKALELCFRLAEHLGTKPNHPLADVVQATREAMHASTDLIGGKVEKPSMEKACKMELKKLWEKLLVDQPDGFTNLWSLIQNEASGTKAAVSEKVKLYGKTELSMLVERLLGLDGLCYHGPTLVVYPFKATLEDKSIGQHCKPDLLYVSTSVGAMPVITNECKPAELSIQLKSATFSDGIHASYRRRYSHEYDFQEKDDNGGDDGDDDGVCRPAFERTIEKLIEKMNRFSLDAPQKRMHIEVMWQVFEQLLGMVFRTEHDVDGSDTILQTGVIVLNNKVQMVALTMDVKLYKHLVNTKSEFDRQYRPAFRTIQTILENYIDNGKLWCNIYVLDKEYNLCHLPYLCKDAVVNHCQAKKTSPLLTNA